MDVPTRWILLTTLCLGLPCAAPAAEARTPSVALVIGLTGKAAIERPGGSRTEPLALLDRLRAGVVVKTAAVSEVTLVFFNGHRVAIGPESRIVVESAGVRTVAGSVRRLEPVPALAEIPRLDRSAHPGRRPGAGRIRVSKLAAPPDFVLYPSDGHAVLSDEATLFFTPETTAGTYRVEVMDAKGRRVFATETTTPEVRVDPGALEPQAFYSWQVSTPAAESWKSRGTALFATLSEADAGARQRLVEQVAAAADPALDLLLAEVERGIGLRFEACDRVAKSTGISEAFDREALLASFDCRATPGGSAFSRVAS